MNDEIRNRLEPVYRLAKGVKCTGWSLEMEYQLLKEWAQNIVHDCGGDWHCLADEVCPRLHDLLEDNCPLVPKMCIPSPAATLLLQCRYLNECLASLRGILPEDQEGLGALAKLNLDALPEDIRKKASQLLRLKAMYDEKQAQLDSISIRAELAAQQIANSELRRVVKRFCIDGKDARDIAREFNIGLQSIYYRLRFLHRPTEKL